MDTRPEIRQPAKPGATGPRPPQPADRPRGTLHLSGFEKTPSAIVYCEGNFAEIDGKTANGLARHSQAFRIVSVIDMRNRTPRTKAGALRTRTGPIWPWYERRGERMTKYAPPHSLPDEFTKPSAGDVPKTRHCLRCCAEFQSTGFGDRICRRCKGSNVWRNGVATTYGKSRGR